jgi:hypothetical protein
VWEGFSPDITQRRESSRGRYRAEQAIQLRHARSLREEAANHDSTAAAWLAERLREAHEDAAAERLRRIDGHKDIAKVLSQHTSHPKKKAA